MVLNLPKRKNIMFRRKTIKHLVSKKKFQLLKIFILSQKFVSEMCD